MCVAKPAADRYRVLWVEDIAGGRVVNDDGLLQISPDLTEVLDVVALMVVAAFPEEAVMYDIVDIELVEEGVAIFGNRRGENDDLIDLSNSLQECIDARPLYDIDVMVLTFDLDWDGKVCLMQDLHKLSVGGISESVIWTRLTLKLL